jgi:uncharacterized protein YbjT (DUF2867 family)
MKNILILFTLLFVTVTINGQVQKNETMKKVLVIGASGSLAKYVIDTLQNVPNVSLTLLARNKSKIVNDTINCSVVVYVNLAGDLEKMTLNIVKAMQEMNVKRVIAISSIGIYETPLKPVLIPYRILADILESSDLEYTILRPDWFTYNNEVSYTITHKGDPEIGSAISRKSIAAFIATIVENPELHKRENLGISKPIK